MLSFILDGFDPWHRVEALLEAINKAHIEESYEVLLISSFLLDTPQQECLARGRALFGDSFRLVANDSVSVFDARLRAQALARGQKFFYLSPTVHVESETISMLAARLEQNENTCSPVLSFRYGRSGTERILAHGHVPSNSLAPVPILLSSGLDCVQAQADYSGVFPNPYCFCSHLPFYAQGDTASNFLQSHLSAAIRQKNPCLSTGQCRTRMHADAFPIYWKSLCQARSEKSFAPEIPGAVSALGIAAGAYGDLRIGHAARAWDWSEPSETEENIFWGLICTNRPEYIAAATRSQPAFPLLELCRQTLMKISAITWDMARNRAEINLRVPGPSWQTFADWEKTYLPLAKILYASDKPDLLSEFRNCGHKGIALKNLLHTVMCGLLWFQRNNNKC